MGEHCRNVFRICDFCTLCWKVWIFGDLWCSIWLAVDVWMCTASILNLCAISLDRYLAVTRPVSYPQASTIYRLFDFAVQGVQLWERSIKPFVYYSTPLFPLFYSTLLFAASYSIRLSFHLK